MARKRTTPRRHRPRRKKGATRDHPVPQALIDFMMTSWREPTNKPPPTVKGAARFKGRRRMLANTFAGETLVIPTGNEKIRVNDTVHPFRAGSDFYYLTGDPEPDCVLVLRPRANGGYEEILFVESNAGRTEPSFFTDRQKGELWVGPRLGPEGSRRRFGVDRGAPLCDLPELLRSLNSGKKRRYRTLRGLDPAVDRALPKQKDRDAELAVFLAEARLIKDEMEVATVKRACDSTRRGFEDVIRALKYARTERDLEGAFNLRARTEGNDIGFPTIAASGANACILHWIKNDAKLKPSDLVLIDAGVESHELYTADITRTLPISGKFTKAQRQIYDLVLRAQAAAIEAVKPDNDFLEPNRVAMRILAHGLEDLGILPMPAEEALRDENQFHKRYALHNVSHMLGLDVHDCSRARAERYNDGKLEPGMILTIEPGVYLQPDDLTVPPVYRGIGVRVEDDVLVTKRGCKILSDLPRESEDIERWMRQIWSRKDH